MPWLPVFIGPLPPAFLAISSRAFLSAQREISNPLTRMPDLTYIHTGCLLQLESLVLLIFLALCGLLRLFVVDRVGTGWWEWSVSWIYLFEMFVEYEPP